MKTLVRTLLIGLFLAAATVCMVADRQEISLEGDFLIVPVRFVRINDTDTVKCFYSFQGATFHALTARTGNPVASGKAENGVVIFKYLNPNIGGNTAFRERLYFKATYQGAVYWALPEYQANKYLAAQYRDGEKGPVLDRSARIDFCKIGIEFIIPPTGAREPVKPVPDGWAWEENGPL